MSSTSRWMAIFNQDSHCGSMMRYISCYSYASPWTKLTLHSVVYLKFISHKLDRLKYYVSACQCTTNMHPYLAISFKMLANRHCFFDKAVQVFGNIRCQSLSFQDTQDLVSGDMADLSHTMRVAKNDTWTRHNMTIKDTVISCYCSQ